MLQRFSSNVQNLLDRATDARDRALHATFLDDRQFWFQMEAKWLTLAENMQQVERTNDFLAAQQSLRGRSRPSTQ